MPPSDPSHSPARPESPQLPDQPTEMPHGPENMLMVPEQSGSAEQERNRRTITSSPAKSRTSQVGSRRASAAINNNVHEPSVRTPFLVVTLILGVASWLIGFVSQAFVTAKYGNPPIATLWFAFVLQSLLLAWLLIPLTSTSPRRLLRASSNTIAHLAAMTAVLASIGINNNVYSHVPAQKATAAGWLIAALVDVLWVIYFSAEEGSGVRTLLGGNWGSERPNRDITVPEEEEEEEAGPVKSGRRGLSFTRKLPPLTPPSFKLKSARLRKPRQDNAMELKPVDEIEPENGITPEDVGSEPSADRRRSAAARSTSVNPGASSIGGDVPGDSRPVSSALSGAGPGSASVRGSAGSRVKAQALYSYKGSETDPHELTFSKGDMFDIIDRSGKWWEALNKDGRSGIVPSNYVHVLE